ncbi:MAG: NAD(P) transhydrogenase subunit alpha [Phycisphaerales bacterium]
MSMPSTTETRAPIVTAALPEERTERRTPITPESVKTLRQAGWRCVVPEGLGHAAGWTDDAFRSSGAEVAAEATALSNADAVFCVEPPSMRVVRSLKPGCLLLGLLRPFTSCELFRAACERELSSIAMELVPRSTRAQPMDALSSQASLAGYAAVVLAASRLPRILPMMTTPAGTLSPASVLVIGTGVAGLQAIATAVRLGAQVTAYDVRSTAKEQAESLGARFARIPRVADTETEQGYASTQPERQTANQQSVLARLCEKADIVIATAQIFGGQAPVLVKRDVFSRMRPGSVLVDLAIATGGNIEGTRDGMDCSVDGVTVIADSHIVSRLAHAASSMLASNMVSLLTHIADGSGTLKTDEPDEIMEAALVTHAGNLRDTAALKLLQMEAATP